MSAQVRHQRGRLPKQQRNYTVLWVSLFVVGSLVSLAALLAVFAAFQPEPRTQQATSNETQPSTQPETGGHFMDKNEIRQIRIADLGEVDPGAPAVAVVTLFSGSIPEDAVMAKVVSDSNCAPDAQGISHCQNELDLGKGRKAVVVHDHVLAKVPCFTPGQTLKFA